ncbi:MAG TPA: hypothetical protein VIT45_12100 [Allosphingosinicella sp.]
MNVIRWFESRFQFLDSFSEMPAVRSIFGRHLGGDEIPSFDEGPADFSAAKSDAGEAHNFVLPNQDDSEPTGELLFGPIKSYNYFAKPIDSGDVHGETLGLAVAGLLGAPGIHAMKGLEGVFGPDSAPLGLLDGPPVDILGAPPVI